MTSDNVQQAQQAASTATPASASEPASLPSTTPAPRLAPPRPTRPYVRHDRPLFFAHRGGSLLAPENTLTAFRRGAELGADALELDIQLTRDGEVVVMHDPQVDRTTNGVGPVSSFTSDELRRLDAGYRFTPDGGQTYPFRERGVTVPSLREVFETFPDLRINIDLKESNPQREQALWRLIQEQRAEDRVLAASFVYAPLVRFRRLTGARVTTSATRRELIWFLAAATSGRLGFLRPSYDALQVPETHRGIRIVSPKMLAAAHRLGLDVHVWTVDDSSDMRRLLDWGVDGVMSDRPDLLAAVLAERG
jgi:glycerophosphoryl diester phosphodiesterase